LKVVIPSNPHDAKGLFKSAVRDPNPVIFFEPKKGYRLIKGEVAGEGEILEPLGAARVSRSGTDLTAIAYGMMHHYALQAAEVVAGEGLSVEVVDVRTLLPLDKATLLASVRKTGKALVIHEDNLTGGYGGEIAAILAEEAFTDLDAPIRRLAGPDVPAMPYSHPLQDWFMLNPEKIADAMRQLAAY
jgi:2-oxoisovalerate dehydrogenase E1 component beta subunit